MTYYSDRLIWAMEKAGVSVRALATVLGTSYQAVKKVIDGRSAAFNSANNAKAAHFLNINSDWLALGIGPVTRSPLDSEYSSSSTTDYSRLEYLRHPLDNPVSPPYLHHLDIKNSVLIDQFNTKYTDHLKLWSAIGSSMAPTIQDQDLVLINTAHTHIDAPGYYLIEAANLLFIKKALIQANQYVTLASENSIEYPDEERYHLNQIDTLVNIRGKVVSWWTRRDG